MKRLHLANIANMAYNYSDILRQFNCESDVLCYDLEHWLSDPSSNIDFHSYPAWYHKVKTLDYLQKLKPEQAVLSQDWLEALQRYSTRLTEVSIDEVNAYKGYVDAFQSDYFQNYDVIYGYAYGAIPPLLYAERKYIPVDLGGLRGLASRTDSFSRMLSCSLKAAPHIIVTNPDVIDDCKALGLDRYTFVPHPIDEALWVPASNAEQRKHALRDAQDADFVILAPARHDWAVKGTDEIIRGVTQFARSVDDKVKCIFIEWGEGVEQSKKLIASLGADSIFAWIGMQSESQLRDFYSAADALIDQVGEARTFGLTTPKAMSAGIPVLTKFDPAMHRWCYSEMPPLLAINNAEDISRHLRQLACVAGHRQEVVRSQRQWIDSHHSKKVIAEKFFDAESKLLSDDACRVYYSLNQKKNEIVYEKNYSGIYDAKYHAAIAYQQMDQRLVDWMKRHLDVNAQLKILDLGCGPGSMIPYLRQFKRAKIYGVDISPAFIEMAKERYQGVDFRVGDAEVLPYPSDMFDVVLCSGMLHHIPDLHQVFVEVRRVLKPGGLIFAREPNEDNFAVRYPQFSFAHLVLKHLIHVSGRKQAIIEPEEHEFHIDFDYGSFVETLAQDFSVIDIEFGQRVSYFYDMLFDGRVAENLETLEAQLEAAPGLNVLVACRAGDHAGEVAPCVTQDIERYSTVAPVPGEHIEAIIELALKVLPTEERYVSQVFELAGDPQRLEKDIKKFGFCGIVRVDQHGLLVDAKAPCFQRVSNLFGRSIFDWNVKDYEGRRLFDSGLVLVDSSAALVGDLARAISMYRDYSLIVMKFPVKFRVSGVAGPEELALLSHTYVLSQYQDDLHVWYVASPKLFTVENLKRALLACGGEDVREVVEQGLQPLATSYVVDFSERNLYKVLGVAE
ncbi:methyltransferase domain-containing protein [Pseudomonas sp. TE50-2]|uniref:methyltransferase domain-containing protein n=1 Tax=Pseudomonas sp. TE50-2 TaxID=3142707 RepID=UPI003466A733